MGMKRSYTIPLRYIVLLCAVIFTFSYGRASICFTPTSIQQQSNTTTSISIDWSDFSTEDEVLRYELSLTLSGETPDLSTYDTSYVKSYTFDNLQIASTYQVRIRTVCTSGSTNWSGPVYIYTEIDSSFPCDLNLHIDDNSCSDPMQFRYEVNGLGDQLGENTFIREVRIAISHAWPADLECSLINPAGDRVVLFQDKGIGSQNVGVISDACNQPLRLDMSACNSVNTVQGGLRGVLKPQGNFEDLYSDSTNPNGDWYLELCDDASGQVGKLKTFEIVFEEVLCEAPSAVSLMDLEDTSIDIGIPAASCDSLELLIFNEMEDSIFLVVPCLSDTISLTNLTPSTSYTLIYAASCAGSNLSFSCPSYFETYCAEESLEEDFESLELCNSSCVPCDAGAIFTNTTDNQWMIGEGATNTDLTGPSAGVYGVGKYIFLESSEDCSSDDFILQSSCLKLSESTGCNLSFFYHMDGSDITSLSIDLSYDGGLNWFSVWSKSGEQSSEWNSVDMQFDDTGSTVFQLRFRATKPTGDQGDIAIDNIRFTGIELLPEADQVFYADVDGDGYGSKLDSIQYCGDGAPVGYVTNKEDCDDMNEAVNPDGIEQDCNGLDDNCNGIVDEDTNSSLAYELLSIHDQSCNSLVDGEIVLEATGGVQPLSIQWNTGQTDFTISNLEAGSYFATITDGGNCLLLTDTFEIALLQSFDFLISSVNPATCLGYEDGGIEIFHDEDNAPFTYTWNNGSDTKDLTGINPGVYSLSIEDVNGCVIETGDLTVASEIAVPLTRDSVSEVSCAGFTDGYASILFDSSYVGVTWNTGEDSYDIANLPAGIYTATVEDTVGCQAVEQIEIVEPDTLMINIVSAEDVSCYGENDGLIEVEANGGNGNYNYMWGTGDQSEKIELLTAGSYDITVTDDKACETSISMINIQEPDSMIALLNSTEPAFCALEIGIINISVSGGTSEYEYQWSNDSIAENEIQNLAAGMYSVTVTDKRNCRVFLDDIEVGLQTPEVNVGFDLIQNIACFGDDNGSIAVGLDNVSAYPVNLNIGDSVYVFVEDAGDIGDLDGGTYLITGEDANGCLLDTLEFSIEEPEELHIVLQAVTSIACGEEGGLIQIDVQGGVEPFNVMWDTGDTDLILDSLESGLYTVYVEDDNGCEDSIVSIEITPSSPLLLDELVLNDPLCFGEGSGSIVVNYSGGEGGLLATLNGNAVEMGEIGGLMDGVYELVVQDEIACNFDTIEFVLEEPSEIMIEVDSIKVEYCESMNGSIVLIAEGGTGEYEYLWSGGLGEQGAMVQGLSAGEYDVIVRDENECVRGVEGIIVENVDKDLSIDIVLIDSTSCFNTNNGKIFFDLIGDFAAPLTTTLDDSLFTYENGGITEIPAGNYSLLITDADGCSYEQDDIEIFAPPAITFEYEILTPIICHDDTTGSILVTAAGGTAPLKYLWDNEDSGELVENLGTGYYRCAIVDKNNCILVTDSIFLENPDTLIVNLDIVNASNGGNNGAIYAATTGGVMPYEYYWNYDLPITADTIEFLSESDWTLNFTDANGCMFDTIFSIQNIISTVDYELLNVSHFPNPADEGIYIQSEESGTAQISIFDGAGKCMRRITNAVIDSKYFLPINQLASGVYFVEVEINGRKKVLRVVKM